MAKDMGRGSDMQGPPPRDLRVTVFQPTYMLFVSAKKSTFIASFLKRHLTNLN